jgi:hypothetical protein
VGKAGPAEVGTENEITFLRSKSDTGQVNEALCKALAHNICVLVHTIHELGIDLFFVQKSGLQAALHKNLNCMLPFCATQISAQEGLFA